MQCSERNGNLVTALQLFEGDEMMLISDKGTLVRTRTDEISVLSRNTQGVRLIKLSQEDERLVGVERIAETDAEDVVLEAAPGDADNAAVEADGVEADGVEAEGVDGGADDAASGADDANGEDDDQGV